MNKLALGIATLLLLTTFLAACGNQESTNANNSGPTTSSNVTDSSSPDSGSVTKTDNNSELSSSSTINWDEVKDPLIDEAIKSKLKASVDAIVIKDVEAFHKTLGPNVGTAHDYLLDNTVEFTDVGKAHEEDGRVLVPVQGENQGNSGNAPEMGYTFYFEKDQAGEWQIVSID